jgi:hypothetical protein
MPSKTFVAYYRVSTDKQGRSGLGLDAQQQAVRQYLNGGNWNLVAEVIEVESGKPTFTGQKRRPLPWTPPQWPQHRHYGTTMPSGASTPSFNLQRHLMSRPTLRLFRADAAHAWQTATAAA